jgi:hypothetical protein
VVGRRSELLNSSARTKAEEPRLQCSVQRGARVEGLRQINAGRVLMALSRTPRVRESRRRARVMAAQDEGIGRHNCGLRRTQRGAPDLIVFAPYMYLDVESGTETETTGDNSATAICHHHGSLASCTRPWRTCPTVSPWQMSDFRFGGPCHGCRDENFTSPPKTGAGIAARLEKSFSPRHLFSWIGPSAGRHKFRIR